MKIRRYYNIQTLTLERQVSKSFCQIKPLVLYW